MKTALFRSASLINRRTQSGLQNHGLASPRRSLSMEATQPAKENSPIDSFLETPRTGLVYGRLFGITRRTTKNDVLNLFEGCSLRIDDLKVDYNQSYAPTSALVQFPSLSVYEAAHREILRKGRLFRMERSDRSQWDIVAPYDGKAVLLQGIPRNALLDDVERFLAGCEYDASTIQLFSRQAFPNPIRMAVIRFRTQAEAMHAFLTKNREFCLNNQILVRLLH